MDRLRLNEFQSIQVLRSSVEALELEATWLAGGAPPPTHWHPHQHEAFEVLEGELTVEAGDSPTRVLGVGDRVVVPPCTPHRMWNAGGVTCRASWSVTPALRTEEMFRFIAGGLTPERGVELLDTFGEEFRLGSPEASSEGRATP